MVNKMICKFCSKNINSSLITCNKCRKKHKNVKCTYIQNNIDYVRNILDLTDISGIQRNFDNYTSGIHPYIQPTDKNNSTNFIAENLNHKK